MQNQNNVIQSVDNKFVKNIRKLRNRKHRSVQKQYVIESRKMILEAIKSNMDIDYIMLSAEIDENFEGYDIRYITSSIFKDISTLTNNDGYMAVINHHENGLTIPDKIILLDRIQDPGNLGTIIRSAEAFDFKCIMLYQSVDAFNEKSLRASMGSVFRTNIRNVSESEIEQLKKSHSFYVADMDGIDYRQEDYPERLALIIGNEANGISVKLANMADRTIKIPMTKDIESLNAAISASLIMSEISK